jgi:DNA-binding transcriptional MocR family regulator
MLRGAGMRLVGVPRTHEGPDTAALRHLAQRHRARVLVLMTQLHNPTGSCCTPAVAYQVLRLAEELDLRIVELDAMAGLEPPGATLLASLDGLKRVAYVGTFSKTLSPSLRVGYVAASEELVEQLVLHKMRASLTSSELVERLLHTLLAEGRHRAQLQRLAERLREAQQRVGDALEAAGLTLFQRPPGGPFLWARLPGEGVDMRAVAQRAVAAGIVLAPGDLFSVGQQRSPWTRLNVACADDPRLMDFLRAEVLRARGSGAVQSSR